MLFFVPSPKDQYRAVIFCLITVYCMCLFSARSEQLVLLLLLLLLLLFSVICSIPGEFCCLYLLLSCGEWINVRVGQLHLHLLCYGVLKVLRFTNKQKSFICCLTHWKEHRKEEKKRTKKEVGKSNTQRFVVVVNSQTVKLLIYRRLRKGVWFSLCTLILFWHFGTI